MKNHVWVNDRLLQTNKSFSALKLKQREWIATLLREKSITQMQKQRRMLSRLEREQVLEETLTEIKKKGIWIPDHEVRWYYIKKVNRYYSTYLKHSLYEKQFHESENSAIRVREQPND
ncbi:hypothetical protein [Paenibacillus agricola]|uniref:Uncharacterized protein n=1 Tax=Paenibacillus agricola TaxID=2716264 RepID=A0ABX0JDK3_9BACL|nr:hypothetical protein [Paenibacillus agricola]NHN33334.1 hypothetical protein [Paenibacillus agricola]